MTSDAAGLLLVPCAYGAVSGFNDGGSLLASFTSGRVISPRIAAALLTLCLLGPLVVGTRVAKTVGLNVIDLADQRADGFALITLVAIGVVLASWRLRLPTSMTLSLVGAMVGWALATPSSTTIHWSGVARVIIAMPLSVLAGVALSLALYRSARRLLGSAPHASALRLARSQYVTSALQAFAYGSNDMEKTVGLVVVAQTIADRHPGRFGGWLPLSIAFASFAFGALLGGWRIARRVGSNLFRVRPVQAMSEQAGAGAVVAGLALLGAPVSSTQTISGSLIGVGVSVRASAVRWRLVREMLTSWLVTLPLAMSAALVCHWALIAALDIK